MHMRLCANVFLQVRKEECREGERKYVCAVVHTWQKWCEITSIELQNDRREGEKFCAFLSVRRNWKALLITLAY